MKLIIPLFCFVFFVSATVPSSLASTKNVVKRGMA